MKDSKIAFIGSGHMAEVLIKGMCEKKAFHPSRISVTDIKSARTRHLKNTYGVVPAYNNAAAVACSQIIILAVKPQDMEKVLKEIKFYVTRFQLVISIAAGVTLETLQIQLKKVPLVRAMPNGPAMVGRGITALSGGAFAQDGHLKTADHIFKTVGETVFVPENYMNAVTALSGSGPAFVYAFLKGLIKGAVGAKLPEATAKRLAFGTLLGAVETAEKTGINLDKLVEMTASKGGTTEAGLKILKKSKFEAAAAEAVIAAAKRSKELSK